MLLLDNLTASLPIVIPSVVVREPLTLTALELIVPAFVRLPMVSTRKPPLAKLAELLVVKVPSSNR